MNCLDTNALIDYLEGEPAIAAYLEISQQPYFAPTIALHEVFVGAARLQGADGVDSAREDLDWLEPLPLTVDGAAEAARIDAELHSDGTPIGALDTLIAGVVREAGGTIVTADSHFDQVDDLATVNYREFGK
ncbi:type II toxin-antitoxin system VapC family toxin [Halorarius litoreus]|uniref:type II toxin-antitoxin system VapC family toxin n=1 Tax=Halorarius litoreus TaxID=2962676 RepID=UPI0020CE963A|nr:type II toxin-antitoxin system VapC family toxin [Halorarius litoreus]